LLIEEFHPQFHYITGPINVLANALSRVPRSSEEEEEEENANAIDKAMTLISHLDLDKFFALEIDDINLTTCLLHYPKLPDNIVFPLEYTG